MTSTQAEKVHKLQMNKVKGGVKSEVAAKTNTGIDGNHQYCCIKFLCEFSGDACRRL